MKSILLKFSFILFFSISFISCAQKTDSKVENNQSKTIISSITSDELSKKLGDIQLVDVRTPEEFAEGHIKNAININYFNDNFMTDISKLQMDKELYIYCRSGNRSGKASKNIKSLGFIKIYDLKGGMLNWSKNKLEIIK